MLSQPLEIPPAPRQAIPKSALINPKDLNAHNPGQPKLANNPLT